MIQDVNTLSDLRGNATGLEPIYVQGHTAPGDGGGGFFLWRTGTEFETGDYSVENNGTIVKSNLPGESGSWVRQYDGYINVLYFGALGFGNDYTVAFQNAIDFASLNTKTNPLVKGSTVFIPNGSYVISNLLLKSATTILGESMERTILYATKRDLTDYMFEIENGPVTLNISNLNLSGQGTDRGAFLFRSNPQDKAPFDGGLWDSRISNINIFGFKGHGIYLQGGEHGSGYLLPNQFNIFENVRVFNESDEYNSLRITGQNGQVTFLNCEFDGYFTKTSESKPEDDVYTFKKNQNVWIENSDIFYAAVISFINCTVQNADYGIFVKWAENITIDNCWFENLGVAVLIEGNTSSESQPSKSINVLNSRFANAAGFGSLRAPSNIKVGQCVNVSGSYAAVNNNYVTVSNADGRYYDNASRFVVTHDNKNGGITAQGNSYQVPKLGLTFGIHQVITIENDNSINCFGHKLLFVGGSTTHFTIETIHSDINAGELLTIRANRSEILIFNTDNIFFQTANGDPFLTMQNGNIATFIKIDNITGTTSNPIYAIYQLVSLIKEI